MPLRIIRKDITEMRVDAIVNMFGENMPSCYTEILSRAVESKCRTVSVPLIVGEPCGEPRDHALRFAIQTITEFLYDHELTVFLYVPDRESYSFSQELCREIRDFIDGEYEEEPDEYPQSHSAFLAEERVLSKCEAPFPMMAEIETCCHSAAEESLEDYLKQMDRGFRDMLFDLIDESGMTDVECYKKANVDKRIFSKIKSNKNYRPSKQMAVAFAIALQLDLEQTQALLATAGMTLSKSRVFDLIICYFIQNGRYDLYEINEALFEFDQTLLGV